MTLSDSVSRWQCVTSRHSVPMTHHPSFNPSILSTQKYSGKTSKFRFLCSIIDAITGISVCDSDQYDTLASVIKNFYFELPSGERNLEKKPDIQGQIGVPELVDQILGRFQF